MLHAEQHLLPYMYLVQTVRIIQFGLFVIMSSSTDPIIWQDGGRHRTKCCRSNLRSRQGKLTRHHGGYVIGSSTPQE